MTEDWQKIPPQKMVTVSRRKYMHLKASVTWKVNADCIKRIKAAELTAAKAEERLASAYQALDRAQNMAVKWMDKYTTLLESK